MCTALTLKSIDNLNFFGRNMDIPGGFNPNPTITPAGYEIYNAATKETFKLKYPVIGMSMNIQGIPLYGDLMNDRGLGVCGLAFLTSEYSDDLKTGANNIPQYMLQPWIAGSFATVKEALPELEKLNIMTTPPFEGMGASPMHWMVHDKSGDSVVIECTEDGMKIYTETTGVMTNYPDYDWHLKNLMNYMPMTEKVMSPEDWDGYKVKPLANGLGSQGLPGSTGSADRFVRVSWFKRFIPQPQNEAQAVTDFFHLLQNGAKPRGSSLTDDGTDEYTFYTSCMCLDNGGLYYNCYTNNQITYLNFDMADKDSEKLTVFEFDTEFKANTAKKSE